MIKMPKQIKNTPQVIEEKVHREKLILGRGRIGAISR
jgi:hypothetical protein